MKIEFLDDNGQLVDDAEATLDPAARCDGCGTHVKVYRFTSGAGMEYAMCVPCIDADEYVRADTVLIETDEGVKRYSID